MSSMRNAVQRRNHKERAQPAHREKWGLLEKHKDYSLRAKDYNEKKKRLKILREKAAERNPDEFSYSMLSSKTDKHGRKIQDRGNVSLSQDAVKLLKTQDAGYIRTVIQQTRRTREKMEQEYLLMNGGSVKVLGCENGAERGSHVIFAENPEEQRSLGGVHGKGRTVSSGNDQMEQSTRKDFVHDSLNSSDGTSPDSCQLMLKEAQALQALKQDRAVRKLRKRGNEIRQSKLSALKTREKELVATEEQLEHQRARMSSSIGGINKAGVKWKIRERKR
ncbi:MAG: hypothetical protein L6R38_002986 [Xanthoria sp. 2 TBL-2021]|nr:MAG: hypothetical protein L6R38_002986 [Xanthoria sp. 2 TBL-2021]